LEQQKFESKIFHHTDNILVILFLCEDQDFLLFTKCLCHWLCERICKLNKGVVLGAKCFHEKNAPGIALIAGLTSKRRSYCG